MPTDFFNSSRCPGHKCPSCGGRMCPVSRHDDSDRATSFECHNSDCDSPWMIS